MKSFKVDEEIVCINARPARGTTENILKYGKRYKVIAANNNNVLIEGSPIWWINERFRVVCD